MKTDKKNNPIIVVVLDGNLPVIDQIAEIGKIRRLSGVKSTSGITTMTPGVPEFTEE